MKFCLLRDFGADAFRGRGVFNRVIMKKLLLLLPLLFGGLAAISSSGCTPLENWGKSPDENLLTYYQKGLEAYLADDYDTAMQNFSKALRYVSKAKDRYAVAQLYGKMAKLYTLLYDFDAAERKAEKAAAIYRELDETSRYAATLLDAANIKMIQGENEAASALIDSVLAKREGLDSVQLTNLYSILLQNTVEKEEYSLVDSIVSDYCSAMTGRDSLVDWLAIAEAYFVSGNYDKASQVFFERTGFMKNIGEGNSAYRSLYEASYYSLLSQILEQSGDYKGALDAYSEYVHLSDEQDLRIFESKARFAEESFEQELRSQQLWYMNLVICLCLALVIIVLALVTLVVLRELRRRKAENEHLRQLRDEAQKEIDDLLSWKERVQLDEESVHLVEERLALLNECIVEHMGGYKANVTAKLEDVLKDRSIFLASTRASFMLSHAEFLAGLRDKGLDGKEISICCLVVSGARGKTVASYLGVTDGTYRNAVLRIRKKLGLNNDVRELSKFLQDLMENSDRGVSHPEL